MGRTNHRVVLDRQHVWQSRSGNRWWSFCMHEQRPLPPLRGHFVCQQDVDHKLEESVIFSLEEFFQLVY